MRHDKTSQLRHDMATRNQRRPKTKATFNVGERVCFPLVNRIVEGVVTEDRGALAANGRHILAVTVKMQPDEPDMIYEIGDYELSPAAPRD